MQELFFTDLVYPQEHGEWQLTLGARLDRATEVQSSLVPLSFEYGITNRWQIEASWEGYSGDGRAPFDHLRSARLTAGTHYSFMNIGGSHIHASVGTEFEFPDAGAFDDGEGEKDGLEIEPGVALAADLPRHVSVFGSVTASFAPREVAGVIHDRGTISMGALVVIHRATLAAEYTNRSDVLPWRLDGAALLTPSLVLHPPAKWELGIGFPIALRGRHQAGVAMNLVKEFGG